MSTSRRSKSPPRVAHPTSETSATFTLNWDYFGIVDPHPVEAASTYIGIPNWGIFRDPIDCYDDEDDEDEEDDEDDEDEEDEQQPQTVDAKSAVRS
jgi:hypothetical protein